MLYDKNKVDEMTMALMYLVSSERPDGSGARAGKGFDWETMLRLHARGWISEPKIKSFSIEVTEEGYRQAQALFFEHFGLEGD
jgi:hypothetical protein